MYIFTTSTKHVYKDNNESAYQLKQQPVQSSSNGGWLSVRELQEGLEKRWSAEKYKIRRTKYGVAIKEGTSTTLVELKEV